MYILINIILRVSANKKQITNHFNWSTMKEIKGVTNIVLKISLCDIGTNAEFK